MSLYRRCNTVYRKTPGGPHTVFLIPSLVLTPFWFCCYLDCERREFPKNIVKRFHYIHTFYVAGSHRSWPGNLAFRERFRAFGFGQGVTQNVVHQENGPLV